MAAQVFEHRHRVTYAECTVGNHVYYGHYLAILETARGEFFRSLGITFLRWQERDAIFPVVECTVKYRRAARYDEVLRIAVTITELKGVRLGFRYVVTNAEGAVVVEAETRHVCTTLAEKPRRLPEELVTALAPYLDAATD